MKQFELNLIRHNTQPGQFKILSMDKIEGDDLVEVLSKLLLVVAKIQQEITKEQVSLDDDIPF